MTHADATALPAETHLGIAYLRVADLARSVDFYTQIIGLTLLEAGGTEALLGAGTRPLLALETAAGVRRPSQRSAGLYHLALLLPSRAELGRTLRHLAQTRYPLSGYSDHLVSEAFYLDDPDGNGLELYRDRPRDAWQWRADQVVMGNAPVDLEAIFASVTDSDAPYTGIAHGTTIGHLHLRVAGLAQARAFYSAGLGFGGRLARGVVYVGGGVSSSPGGEHLAQPGRPAPLG